MIRVQFIVTEEDPYLGFQPRSILAPSGNNKPLMLSPVDCLIIRHLVEVDQGDYSTFSL